MIGRLSGIVATVLFLAMPLNVALGHSGGTNAAGCHTNHTTGDYHCHTPKSDASGQVTYCHVINGEYRCGYALSTCNGLVGSFGGYCVTQ